MILEGGGATISLAVMRHQVTDSDDDYAKRVASVLGLDSVRLEQLSPGTSRGAVRVLSDDGAPIAFLRVDLGGANMALGRTLADEIAIIRRAYDLAFPVPKVFALLENPSVAVMELARGTSRPDAAEAERVGPEFMGHIARLHRVDPAEFGLASAATVTAAIDEDLNTWVADADSHGLTNSALIRLAVRILRHTMPQNEARPAMLHGDVGAGNFMVDDGKVTAILDWELAHAGDTHEDLAWLWIRGAHTPFGDPRQRISEYEAAAGESVDPARLAWQVAFVTLKSVLGLQRRMHAEDDDPGLLPIHIVVLTYEALLCAALGKVVGVDVPLLEETPVGLANEDFRLMRLLALLSPPSSREGQILLKYLRDSAHQQDWRARRLREDAHRLLEAHPDDLDALVDTAPPERFPSLIQVLGAAAGRRCKAMPNAERRVMRAFSIGLGR